MKKIPCEICPIRDTTCVADVPIEELDEFRTFGTSSIYKARQVLFHEGTPAAGLYILCHGSVKLFQSGRFGRELILAIAGPGDVLGEMPTDVTRAYSASAEALTESQLCYLPREKLVQFIERHPSVGMRLVAAMSDALIAARRQVRNMVLKPAESRLAELLARLAEAGTADQNGARRVTLAFSRRDIAEMIGVSTETAIRLLAKLKEEGVITAHGRELVISDIYKLNRLANTPVE